MFQSIVVMHKGRSRIIRWINIDAFHLTCELLLQRLKGKQVVAMDEHVVEDVLAILPARGGVIRFFHILHQHARLKARALVFPDPG